MIEETIVSLPPAVPMEEAPASLGPAAEALPLELAATGLGGFGAAVSLIFCALSLAVLLLPLSRALRSYEKERNRKG